MSRRDVEVRMGGDENAAAAGSRHHVASKMGAGVTSGRSALAPVAYGNATVSQRRPSTTFTRGTLSTSSRAAALSRGGYQKKERDPLAARVASIEQKPLPRGVENIDRPDCANPQAPVEYVDDIMAHAHTMEVSDVYSPSTTYLSQQPQLTAHMRAVLVDWLVLVHLKFRLHMHETLFLALNLADRYMSRQLVPRNQMQLVGVTAMYIAAKHEETYHIECMEFVYISDKLYTKEEIFAMERRMLKVLDFRLLAPTTLHFLRRYSKAAFSDVTRHTLSKYLLEVAALSYDMLRYRPSLIAACATYLAAKMTNSPRPWWNATMEHYTTYTVDELAECGQCLVDLALALPESELRTVFKKYSSSRYMGVSRYKVPEKFN